MTDSKINVLIAYETIPEGTDFYLIPMNKEEFEKVKKTHGKYVNCDGEIKECEWLWDRILPKKEKLCLFNTEALHAHEWSHYKLVTKKCPFDMREMKFDYLIVTGCIL